MTAMPMMPMLEAKVVRRALPILVFKLLNESLRAVIKLMLVFLRLKLSGFGASWYGSLSDTTLPSWKRMILSAYLSAMRELWVTTTTRRSLATSLMRSMI
ncbi:MAG: hypothetical protein BWY85_02160 [Firmicutes bacterium ADurb.Bin506]|nr:MAG: hypothetical protein BWY85_02160 [Firmicutes bacterium ADurb.Bin506]